MGVDSKEVVFGQILETFAEHLGKLNPFLRTGIWFGLGIVTEFVYLWNAMFRVGNNFAWVCRWIRVHARPLSPSDAARCPHAFAQ